MIPDTLDIDVRAFIRCCARGLPKRTAQKKARELEARIEALQPSPPPAEPPAWAHDIGRPGYDPETGFEAQTYPSRRCQ